MECLQQLLAALVENVNEVNKAVNVSMSVYKMLEKLTGASETAAKEKEEAYILSTQITNQLQSLKYISDLNAAKHSK